MRRTLFLFSFLLGLSGAGVPTLSGGTNVVHFQLSKSIPEAGTTVDSPSEVRLWFTQIPQQNTTSIRVLDTQKELLQTAEVVQDPSDGRVFSVALESSLVPGVYTVAWRALGADGHVVRGEFNFTVKGK